MQPSLQHLPVGIEDKDTSNFINRTLLLQEVHYKYPGGDKEHSTTQIQSLPETELH